jgi:hypothetical protein
MKILKSPQKALILFLTVLVVLSFIMILRLEGKTALLQSRLDEHHKSLEINKDVLDNLVSFSRMIKNNGISIDGNKVILQSGQSTLTLQNNNIDISSNGDIAIGTPTKSFVHIQKDGDILIGPDNKKSFGYNAKKDIIYLQHNKVSLAAGSITSAGGKKKVGILIKSPNKNSISITDEGFIAGVPGKTGSEDYRITIAKDKFVQLRKGKSKITMEDDDITFEAEGYMVFSIDKDKEFGYSPKKDLIYLIHNKAYISVGTQTSPKGKNYIGVAINSPNGNELRISDEGFIAGVPGKTGSEDYRITIAKDKFVQLRKGKSKITMENDDINIEALGDINITSKNGNVNINGKKVSLNE